MTLGYEPKIADIKFLPKYMQRKPEIRALTLKVYRGDGPRHFRVPGTSEIHDVFLVEESYRCSCKAAFHNVRCAHSIAVQKYCESQEKK